MRGLVGEGMDELTKSKDEREEGGLIKWESHETVD